MTKFSENSNPPSEFSKLEFSENSENSKVENTLAKYRAPSVAKVSECE